jgi:hypothetical protein
MGGSPVSARPGLIKPRQGRYRFHLGKLAAAPAESVECALNRTLYGKWFKKPHRPTRCPIPENR